MYLKASVIATALFGLFTFFVSCQKEFHQVSGNLFASQALQSKTLKVQVNTFQEGVTAVESNGLPLVQLGQIKHPIFGLSKAQIVSQLSVGGDPFFGNYRQAIEDNPNADNISQIPENEQVKEVYLEIPFFTNQRDSDNDGVVDAFDADPNDPNSNSDSDELNDLEETQANLNPLDPDSDGDGILDHNDDDNSTYDSDNNTYEIDSLYGNRQATFNLKVAQLTYYLNTLDPNRNFEKAQLYYSNRDFFEEGFYSTLLHDGQVQLNFDELRFNYKEDDPETEDVDETTRIETRLSPRLRVPLNKTFFQEQILDKEDAIELANNSNFNEYFRGIIIKTENFSEDLYMLLDLSNASIKLEYTYDVKNTNGTLDNNEDDFTETEEKTFEMPLAGIQINTLKNSAFDTAISDQMVLAESGQQADKLFIKSGQWHGRVRLFGSSDGNVDISLIDSLRDQNQLLNEARISFYVDQQQQNNEILLPPRLYLFDLNNGSPLLDQRIDDSENADATNASKFRFGGFLEYDGNRPYRYVFTITEHVSNILRQDSTNVDLGVVVSADVTNLSFRKAKKQNETALQYPTAAVLNPLGVVLIGSSDKINAEENKTVLELFFTSF
jgi:hypothetical protein